MMLKKFTAAEKIARPRVCRGLRVPDPLPSFGLVVLVVLSFPPPLPPSPHLFTPSSPLSSRPSFLPSFLFPPTADRLYHRPDWYLHCTALLFDAWDCPASPPSPPGPPSPRLPPRRRLLQTCAHVYIFDSP